MTRQTGPSKDVVRLVWERDLGACALCGERLRFENRGQPFNGWSYHHRAGRLMGGTKASWINAASNGVILAGTGTTGCHGEVTAHPRKYAESGFIVRRGILTPAEVPIRHYEYGECFLTDAGTVSTHPPTETLI